MTKAEVLYNFWSSFGIPAYESGSVPDDAPFPRITYDLYTGDYGQTVFLSASIWYRTTTLSDINDKTDEIARTITLGGIKLPCGRGHIHLYCGDPWAQSMDDPDDDMIKRKYINITARFNTMP